MLNFCILGVFFTSCVAIYCPQLPIIEPKGLADDYDDGEAYRWDNLPADWICDAELYYQIKQNATYITCDCGCGAIDPDCGFEIENCGVQTWDPVYDDIYCEGNLQPRDLYYCRLESFSCTLLPAGLSRAKGISEEWNCIPDVYNELSDPMTSLNDCDCNCGGFDIDCLGAYDDIYCSDYVDAEGTFLPRTWANGPFCLVHPQGAFCQDVINDENVQDDGSIYCPQLPALAPWQIAAEGSGYGNPPDTWTCDRWEYYDGFTCDCECGAIDPDCGYNLRSCGDQTWNPEYTAINCAGIPTYLDWAYCRLESARCTALPPGLSRGAVSDWTCIPDVYNELSDDMTSLNDCDCNCNAADPDCFGQFEDIYCLEVVDETGSPLPNKRVSSGITCEVQSQGVACNIPVQFDTYEFPTGVRAALTAIVALCDIALAVGMGMMYNWENTPLMKRTGPLFVYLLLGSGIVMCTSSLLLVTAPSFLDNICSLRIWMLTISFLCFISPMMAKIHHFTLISKKLKKRRSRFPETQLYRYLFMMCSVQVILNTILVGIINPTVVDFTQSTTLNPDMDYTLVEVCTSDFIHLTCTLLYCFGLLAWAMSLAYETRHMPSKFNENTPILVGVGFMFVFGLMLIALQFMLRNNPTEVGVLRVIGVCLGVMVVCGSSIGPKILFLVEDPNADPPSLDSQGQPVKTKNTKGGSGGSHLAKVGRHEGRSNTSQGTSVQSDSDDSE